MPRILRIINRFNLGGPTYNVAYLTKYLAPEFETMLVGGMKDETEESSVFILKKLGIDPVIIPEMRREIGPRNDWIAYHKIRKLIEAYKPDIVHTHAAKAGTLGRIAALSLGVPVIVHTFHGHVFHSYFGKVKTLVYKNIERFLAKRTSAIVAISQRQKEELSQIHKIAPPEKISVIPLGFDLSRFSVGQTEKRSEFRKKYQVEEDEIAIGIVGRLVPVKNHRLFLDAIKYVSENSHKKIRAFIIGDGESMPEIQNRAAESGLDFSTVAGRSLLTFTSWIHDIDVAYAGLDIVALTSFNEGTPVSLIEAQAAQKPVVSTNVGGIENIILGDETGFLSEISNPSGFFVNLNRLVQDDRLRIKFGESANKNVYERFHYDRLISDMKNLYRNLL